MSKAHNSKRAVGLWFNSPLGWLVSLGAIATIGGTSPDTFLADEQPVVSEAASKPATESIDKQIEKIGEMRSEYNAASNVYYSNLYADRNASQQAAEKMEQLQNNIKRQSFGVLANTYLNPNLDHKSYESIIQKVEDLDLPVEIPLKNGETYNIGMADSEYYKSCQISIHHDFSKAGKGNPLDQAMDVHKCQIEEAQNERGQHFGNGIMSFGAGIFLLWLLQAGTNTWSYYDRKTTVKKQHRHD